MRDGGVLDRNGGHVHEEDQAAVRPPYGQRGRHVDGRVHNLSHLNGRNKLVQELHVAQRPQIHLRQHAKVRYRSRLHDQGKHK